MFVHRMKNASFVREKIAPYQKNFLSSVQSYGKGSRPPLQILIDVFYKTYQILKCRFWITESFALQIYFLTNLNFVLMQLREGIYPSIIGSLKFSSPLDLAGSVFRSLFVHL